jgi:hypothetical protein
MMPYAIVLVVPVVLESTNSPSSSRAGEARLHPFSARCGGWPCGTPIPSGGPTRAPRQDAPGGPYRTGGITGTGGAVLLGGGAS